MRKNEIRKPKDGWRKEARLLAVLSFVVLFAFTSFADITSDTPQLSGSQTGAVAPAVITAPTGNGSSSSSVSQPSSGSTSTVTSTAPIMSDTPVLGGNASSQTITAPRTDDGQNTKTNISIQAPASETSQAGTTATGAKPVEETKPGTTASQTKEDGTVLSDKPSGGKSAEGGTISTAPVEASETKNDAPQVTVTQTTASTQTATVAGPSSTAKKSQSPGSVYANDPVTRVNLDFSLITPTHQKGVLNVARAKIKQEDGSWQSYEYKDNIHYAFYKMSSSTTDSSGSWYIASVKAKRFGDTYSNDGKFKTELWLNASDCITRSTIDVNTTNEKRIAVVKAALALLGKQYIYGANGPDAYDCSGLVKTAFKEAGITVPRTSTQLLQLDGQITAAELRPGDIMARAGHCGIYIGNGIFVHASDSSVGVVAEYLSVYNMSNKFTHYINVFGD